MSGFEKEGECEQEVLRVARLFCSSEGVQAGWEAFTGLQCWGRREAVAQLLRQWAGEEDEEEAREEAREEDEEEAGEEAREEAGEEDEEEEEVEAGEEDEEEEEVEAREEDEEEAGRRGALARYCACYRTALSGVIREDFYSLDAQCWAARYSDEGELSVPLLSADERVREWLAGYACSVEGRGKSRYASERPCYPPGEVRVMSRGDERRHLVTGVNMTAVGSGQMLAGARERVRECGSEEGGEWGAVEDAPVHWIYHSPHLREFLRVVMGCESLHPYLSDLGVAVNIMRPPTPSLSRAAKGAIPPNKTALGFHFDSIDSSSRNRITSGTSGTVHQPRGATGVIGIQDCEEGGERVVFPNIHRADVDDVRKVVEQFDPLNPGACVGSHHPEVFTEATAGMLYLFDGGDVLHGVSAVRRGVRIAAVFLFQEDHAPEVSADSDASAKYFYDDDDPKGELTTAKEVDNQG
jgi:hypothetical protein